jgi:GMP synthase-like glutamine amidotransferase
MRVHCFQHVPFEGLGSISGWLESRSARVTSTRFFEDSRLPVMSDIDWLIVLGGPMSANDEETCPWLGGEKKFIAEAVARNKIVLGICLGAQLIARALGARVYANGQPEIGWFPIERTGPDELALAGRLFPAHAEGNAQARAEGNAHARAEGNAQARADVFHWHGETFDLPPGALGFARSEACENQAFVIGDRVVGFQFHLETTPTSARAMIASCRGDLVPGRFVQTEDEILASLECFDRINTLMESVLESLSEVPSAQKNRGT